MKRPKAIATRRMTLQERLDFLATLQSEGWLAATLDDTPRYVAKCGEYIGWGYDRESAIRTMEAV